MIDIGERANPEVGEAWATAKESFERYRVEMARNSPTMQVSVHGSDERDISPFPKPFAPRGYVTVEVPMTSVQLELQYALVDYARRPTQRASADRAAAALQQVGRSQQTVAYLIELAYFEAQDAEGAVGAAMQNLRTAELLLSSSEEQFNNGRATLPDVENARAGQAQAKFQLAQAKAAVQHAKISLSSVVGADPTPAFQIDDQTQNALPSDVSESIETLLAEARKSRPDLIASIKESLASLEEVRKERAAYLPTLTLAADAGQTSEWPSADYGELGSASVSTWHAYAALRWTIFDGARSHRVAEAEASHVRAREHERAVGDAVSRQVWDAYVDFQAAVEQVRDAEQFLATAKVSYEASSEAYRYGVRSLVDVVQNEKALADARFSVVHSRTMLFRSAAGVVYGIGSASPERSSSAVKHP